jgi:hypothetical protein
MNRRQAEAPILIKDRETDKSATESSECITIKPNFAHAIKYGMNPRKALEKCPPAAPKDITKELLEKCVEAGLGVPDIAQGFGTIRGTIYTYAAKCGFKFSHGKTDEPKEKPAAVTAFPLQPEKTTGDAEPPTGVIEYFPETSSTENDDIPFTDEPPLPSAAKPVEEEFVISFGEQKRRMNEIVISTRDLVVYADPTLLLTSRFKITATKGLTKIRFEPCAIGNKFVPHTETSCKFNCGKLVGYAHDIGLNLPAVYDLDPKTLTGTLRK